MIDLVVDHGRPDDVCNADTDLPDKSFLVLGIAISAATWGCRRIAAYLARTWRVRVAPALCSGCCVGWAWRRGGPG